MGVFSLLKKLLFLFIVYLGGMHDIYFGFNAIFLKDKIVINKHCDFVGENIFSQMLNTNKAMNVQ